VFFYNEDAKCFFFLDIFFFLRAKPLTVCRTSYIYVDYTGSNIPPVAENMKLKTGLEPELARNLNWCLDDSVMKWFISTDGRTLTSALCGTWFLADGGTENSADGGTETSADVGTETSDEGRTKTSADVETETSTDVGTETSADLDRDLGWWWAKHLKNDLG
jgi:hypothetical protein